MRLQEALDHGKQFKPLGLAESLKAIMEWVKPCRCSLNLRSITTGQGAAKGKEVNQLIAQCGSDASLSLHAGITATIKPAANNRLMTASHLSKVFLREAAVT